MERREYEMTEADLDMLLNACKPVPMIMLQCGTPSSPQENANRAWAALGRRMGFDGSTVKPTGKGDRFFTAVPTEPPCAGKNCGCTDGASHSQECLQEHENTVSGSTP